MLHNALGILLLISTLCVGIGIGQLLAMRKWKAMAKLIEASLTATIGKRYSDYWDAKYGTPKKTIRTEDGKAKVIDLRNRK